MNPHYINHNSTAPGISDLNIPSRNCIVTLYPDRKAAFNYLSSSPESTRPSFVYPRSIVDYGYRFSTIAEKALQENGMVILDNHEDVSNYLNEGD